MAIVIISPYKDLWIDNQIWRYEMTQTKDKMIIIRNHSDINMYRQRKHPWLNHRTANDEKRYPSFSWTSQRHRLSSGQSEPPSLQLPLHPLNGNQNEQSVEGKIRRWTKMKMERINILHLSMLRTNFDMFENLLGFCFLENDLKTNFHVTQILWEFYAPPARGASEPIPRPGPPHIAQHG